jgi:hypothetical protein
MRPSLLRHLRPLALLLAAIVPCLARAQNAPDSARCYQFDRAYFGYPPQETAVLQLTPRHHPEPRLGTEGRVIELPTLHPDSAQREQRQRYSGWAPLRADSVIVVWRNGIAGYRMRLAMRGDSLIGISRFLTDDRLRSVRPSRTTAVRVGCPRV